MATISQSLLESVLNHIALPPKLPGRQDGRLELVDRAILERLLEAIKVCRLPETPFITQWESLRRSIETCKQVNAGGRLNKSTLIVAMRELQRGDTLIVHVSEQNAALLIRRQNDVEGERVVFEAFEASASSDAVLASKSALLWEFPGSAVSIPSTQFDDPDFQDELATFLEKASTESIKRFAAATNKARSFAFENRNTVDPALITKMLMTLLEVNGRREYPPLLPKRVRDDVCWSQGGEKPWRRSPLWLIIRVAIQRHFSLLLGGEMGRIQYKFLGCVMLTRLLSECVPLIHPEVCVFLKAKLCRRLAKLDQDRTVASSELQKQHDFLFSALGPQIRSTIETSSKKIADTWETVKAAMHKPGTIMSLSKFADPRHMFLTLPNSYRYLRRVLDESPSQRSTSQLNSTLQLPQDYHMSANSSKPGRKFAGLYFDLSKLEEKMQNEGADDIGTSTSLRCQHFASLIQDYLTKVGDKYETSTEMLSAFLLTVMELWVAMDKCALQEFDMLRDFNPAFPSSILDVLHLGRRKDMLRAQKIRSYLRDRHLKCDGSHFSIFNDPEPGCFAQRFYDECEVMKELRRGIENDAEDDREAKKKEWQNANVKFEALVRQEAEASCIYTTDQLRNPIHDDRRCSKCYFQRQIRKCSIKIHEHPLPSYEVHAKVVIFELSCPKSFLAYRDATWRILSTFMYMPPERCSDPHEYINKYSGLGDYASSDSSLFRLASFAKSFKKTHYAQPRLPVRLDDICLPNGLKLAYFDDRLKFWPGRISQKVSFPRHCRLIIPANSPFASVINSSESFNNDKARSSYEVIASQTKCPSGLNVHEYLAFQALCSGKSRRWLQILIELGSSNLNFSTEATTKLIGHLALQLGPDYQESELGKVHQVFRDDLFCQRLIEQLEYRLEAISSNWRETHCMESLITIGHRIFELADSPAIAAAFIAKTRNATASWISALRTEAQNAENMETADRCSHYTLLAALLCRRTFEVYISDDDNVLEPDELSCFIECSIALQDSLVGDPDTLPPNIKAALIRDLHIVHQMRHILRSSIENAPSAFLPMLKHIWPMPEKQSALIVSTPSFLPAEPDGQDSWWVVASASSPLLSPQTVHLHILEGHLLVMGKPIGKLPPECGQSLVVKQLFGDQSLLTFPSPLPGMTYMLAAPINDHIVHIGFRDKTLIVRAIFRGIAVLELVPEDKFRGALNFDLPAPLVQGCVHWLDINTGIIEIRQKPHIWRSKLSNWSLNLNTRLAHRRRSTLIDPNSPLAHRVIKIFRYFETPENLTIFQPGGRGRLTVEIRHLNLTFHVNDRNLLECAELRSEIDPNQDAGTWYGLMSKLVLREIVRRRDSVTNRYFTVPHHQRSILVPMGRMSCKIERTHQFVVAENNGSYARYMINVLLQRLDCAAEPRLLYLKAMYHAVTSFCLQDPLTGRTGTEEALHCLRSGYCQPWAPIPSGSFESLKLLAQLTPRREYYPKELKNMQSVHWNPHLTTNVQHDDFRVVVDSILEQSRNLTVFAPSASNLPALDENGENHLISRSGYRRALYERQANFVKVLPVADETYVARDRWCLSRERSSVIECVRLLRAWPSSLPTIKDLAGALKSWPIIGGFNGLFQKTLLTDILDLEYSTDWGSLVNLCRTAQFTHAYKLMFTFSMLAYRHPVNVGLLHSLIAYAVLPELKALTPPSWPSFIDFRPNEFPSVESLSVLMEPYLTPYSGDIRSEFEFNLNHKVLKRLAAVETAHIKQQKADCQRLSAHLLAQWPCPEPSISGFETAVLIDIQPALQAIRPEWLRLFQNMELSNYISRVQRILDEHNTCTDSGHTPMEDLQGSEVQLKFMPRVASLPVPTLQQVLSQASLDRTVILKTQTQADYFSGSQIGTQGSDVGARPIQMNPPASNFKQIGPNAFTAPKNVKIRSREAVELEGIIKPLLQSNSLVQRVYAGDLGHSLTAFEEQRNAVPIYAPFRRDQLSKQISNAWLEANQKLLRIGQCHSGTAGRVSWLKLGGLWPAVTPVTALENLRSTIPHGMFTDSIRGLLTAYALSVIKLQRLLRIEEANLKNNNTIAREEHENSGHANWCPIAHPDWLLLEIDANILIRPGQVEVAFATISPQSHANSVLQMNMGQGKTSCIMPMAAAVLANGHNLSRIVVPKPLLVQTAQLLHARLGGLLGRELRHIPFSRKTPTDAGTISLFHGLHLHMRRSSGVIISLPEHILSFKLSGLQRLSDGKVVEAKAMIDVQKWLENQSRDVLDECDNILALRTQLIYPSGSQKTVDGHPHRWEISEGLLSLVDGHLHNLQKAYPQSIEVIRRQQGGFPVVFFLRRDVEDELISRLVDDIFRGRTSILPRNISKSDRVAIKQYVSQPKVSQELSRKIGLMFPEHSSYRQAIYLLRGLLVHRILLMTLKKRWNVQYGLHPTRDPIAVPYHAKGTPSDQAEWGHPDVAILFTCLAFYYQGLHLPHLRQTLEHVLKSDDSCQVYDRFAHNSSLPDSLKDWNAINVDDEAQLAEILRHIRYNVHIIDYFLNNFVFPKHAKQFQIKLQASGWDIPIFPIRNKNFLDEKATDQQGFAKTTGFSGTNDWKRMLPLTINQDDLPGLAHTNAEVLTYLLQPRNRRYILAADNRGRHISEYDLLRKITNEGIRVLIDAGAQILEMTNADLVRAWLDISHEAPAAVYFDEDNKTWVRYRQGSKIPLLASPFASDLGDCLVYLDEAHTRGTDLKIRKDSRGALTLGLGQTKDHTVQGTYKESIFAAKEIIGAQRDMISSYSYFHLLSFHATSESRLTESAAMRLRQLGTTQSVTFFAPPEVNQSILDLTTKKSYQLIDSSDVVRWLLEQTCTGIEQLQPLYFSQGADFCRRTQAELDNSKFISDPNHRKKLLDSIRQVEQQTLEQLYGVQKSKQITATQKPCAEIAGFMEELQNRRQNFQDTGNAVHASALQEVEQEREVAHEVEAVREVQKQIHYPAFTFPKLHQDLITFAKTGRLAADSSGYELAFSSMKAVSFAKKYSINADGASRKLYVSSEFTRAAKVPFGRTYDQFQRPVNWILWSPNAQVAIIVIPEEAELLLPLARSSQTAHVISYTAPVTRRMLHFNDLSFYTVPSLPKDWKAPRWLQTEIGIFAGRLYFPYEEYHSILNFLGVSENSGKIQEEDLDLEDTEELSAAEKAPEDRGTERQSIVSSKLVEEDKVIDPLNVVEDCKSNIHLEPVQDQSRPQVKVFPRKPLAFMQEWLTMKRKGQDISETPMGYICQGKELFESHPFFIRQEDQIRKEPKVTMNNTAGLIVQPDDDDVDDDAVDEQYEDYEEDEDDFDDAVLDHEDESSLEASDIDRLLKS